MSIRIINSCQEKHELDAEKIVKHILERIPEKFLIGLNEVRIVDSKHEEYPDIKYVPQSNKSQHIVIEINMNHPALSGIPFFSILTLNAMFLFVINDHIKKYLKHHSEDKEILSYPSGRVNYNWMYLGIWSPLVMIFKIVNYVISKIRIFHKVPLYFVNRASKYREKHDHSKSD